MLHFARIEVSKGIDVNKTRKSKECNICHYWYFLNKDFNFQGNVCNRRHVSLKVSMNLGDIAILNINSVERVFQITSWKSNFENLCFREES